MGSNPPHPPPHCSLKFVDGLFYQLKQKFIYDSCSTRYAFICANSRRSDGTNDGTDYEDGWLTSLNAQFVETTKKVGMHPDGMGLYLKVKDSGKKYLIYRYQDNKRRRDMSFSPYPSSLWWCSRINLLIIQHPSYSFSQTTFHPNTFNTQALEFASKCNPAV